MAKCPDTRFFPAHERHAAEKMAWECSKNGEHFSVVRLIRTEMAAAEVPATAVDGYLVKKDNVSEENDPFYSVENLFAILGQTAIKFVVPALLRSWSPIPRF